MTGRMLEAIQRKLWEAPTEEMTSRLKELYLEAEGYLEWPKTVFFQPIAPDQRHFRWLGL